MFSKKIQLPTKVDDYNKLVDLLMKKFKLEDKNHTIATLHLANKNIPKTEVYTTLDHLGNFILKSIANQVAEHSFNVMNHGFQVTSLKEKLLSDPNDTEARDMLVKAANDGSEQAKAALQELEAKAVI